MPLDDALYQLIRHTPKVVLHDHLGGSTDIAVLKAMLIDKAASPEELEWERLRETFRVQRSVTYERYQQLSSLQQGHPHAPEDPVLPSTLEEYRQAYDRSAKLVKTLEAQYLSAYLYVHRAVSESVRYAEIRFNPFGKGGSPEELTHWICEGLNDARATVAKTGRQFDYGLLFTAYRHGSTALDTDTGLPLKVKRARDVAKMAIALRLRGYPVVGVDLAGNEADNPVTDFVPMFQLVQQFNAQQVAKHRPERRLGITIHAGETPFSGSLSGPDAIRQAIVLARDAHTPVRIGHGIQAQHDEALIVQLAKEGVGLEMCPKSNAQTMAVLPQDDREPSYKHHPAVTLLRRGVRVSISPDNQTVSNSDTTNEFVKLHQHLEAYHAERKQFVLNGLETAFVFDPVLRQQLNREIRQQFAWLESDPGSAYLILKEQLGEEPTRWQRLGLVGRATVGLLRRELGRVATAVSPAPSRSPLPTVLG